MTCNTPLWPLLGLTGSQRGLIWLISRSCQLSFRFLQISESEGNGCRGNPAVERHKLLYIPGLVIILGMKTTEHNVIIINTSIPCSPDILKWKGFSLGISPSGSLGMVGSIVKETQNIFLWLLKKTKRRHYESDSDYKEIFPKFIILESKELPLTKLSPFIIEKTISSIIIPKSTKTFKMEPSS